MREVRVPAYSGGNRWVGVLALAPLPVPPPLHRLARDRITARTSGSSYINVRGHRVSADTAERALSLLGRLLGAHDDLLRQATCFALARALRLSKTRPEAWPAWVQNAVLAYAARPHYFESPAGRDLRTWQLGSSRPQPLRAGGRQREAPRKLARTAEGRSAASHVSAPPNRIFREPDIVRVASPVLLDPGEALDDLPLGPGLERALTEAGWDCVSMLRRRWLRLAVMHVSYVGERHGDLPVDAELLRMLGSLGARWCRLYALEVFAEREPLASAHEQSQAWAGYSTPMAEQLGQSLDVDQAILLGRGEASTSRDPHRRSRTHGSVTWQIIGVMCLLGGLPAVDKLAKTAYEKIANQTAPTIDWVQIANKHAQRAGLAWEYRRSGPDHQAVFEATLTDRRGRTGKGSSNTKSGARSTAAEDFLRRYMPTVVRAEANIVTRQQPSRPIRPAAVYTNVGTAHDQALRSMREVFELSRSADPFLAQALTHASWTYEHQILVKRANQRDCTPLAHLGSVVADALIAHEQASRVASRTLAPSEDEARLMTPRDQRLRDLFEDLQLQSGLLLGAGVPAKALPSISAESMQAVLGVAWKYRRERLLTRRPGPVDEWLRAPNGLLDPSTLLQQMCSEFKIDYSIEYVGRGPDHDPAFAAVLQFSDGPVTIAIRGPFAVGKTEAKHRVSEQALAALDTNVADGDQRLQDFFFRQQVRGVRAADARRCVLRGWLGVSYVAAADIGAFERWAEDTESIGPLTQGDLARLRSYYERCLLITRVGSLPLLRSLFAEITKWIQQAESVAEARADGRLVSLRAVAGALGAITAVVPGSVRGSISDWYGSVAGKIDIDLSSERLEEDQDDLTAAQAAALSSLLDTASAAVTDGGRLQVAVYRQDSSARVAVTSHSANLHSSLADLVRLLDECVSYFACVQIEQGWLIEVRYINPVAPTSLRDLGRSLETTADERPDLLSLARRTAYLLNLIETDVPPDDLDSDHRALAAELFRRRGLI
jgi:dsRNA-specific ribonuclease